MFGEIFSAIALWYGYRSIYILLSENFGLVVILAALLGICLVYYQGLKNQIVRGPTQVLRIRVFNVIVISSICGFLILVGFTVFYERKKMQNNAYLLPVSSITSNLPA